MTSGPQYKMAISTNVLEHLGINLYSNVPAVLSEAVANAWDADAPTVNITIDRDGDEAKDSITIFDTGSGMTLEDINNRFLFVGYRKRDDHPGLTPAGRPPMGRKGIGKLSLFSVADRVEVYTAKNGEKNAFAMELPKIRDLVQASGGTQSYEPEPLNTGSIDFTQGTRIVLRGLRKRQTIRTSPSLRKRLARRFVILGAQHNFQVFVDGTEVTPADRGYYEKLQFLWTYGDQTEVVALATNVAHQEDRTTEVAAAGISISGWIGTVESSGDLKDEDAENLNRVAVFVRGKLAQEDILGEFTERGVYVSYVVGEIRVDDLDLDGDEDAATSSRQKLVEDDPRYLKLKAALAHELKHIESRWTQWRHEEGGRKAEEIPAIKSWLDSFKGDTKKRARRWIGRLYGVRVDNPEERVQMMKHAIVAFEFYQQQQNLDRLDKIDDENLEQVISIFDELDSLERALYGQIVQQRVSVIRALKEKVDANNKEKAIQQYLYDHLWLLDSSWERAEASEFIEARVKEALGEVDQKLLTKEELAGRLDIGYRTSAGRHMIVELKRPEITVSVHDLARQVGKYRSAVRKALDAAGKKNEPIEIVCLLGGLPKEFADPDGPRIVEQTLAAQGARVLLYDQLLEQAYRTYSDYLAAAKTTDRLSEIFDGLENYDT